MTQIEREKEDAMDAMADRLARLVAGALPRRSEHTVEDLLDRAEKYRDRLTRQYIGGGSAWPRLVRAPAKRCLTAKCKGRRVAYDAEGNLRPACSACQAEWPTVETRMENIDGSPRSHVGPDERENADCEAVWLSMVMDPAFARDTRVWRLYRRGRRFGAKAEDRARIVLKVAKAFGWGRRLTTTRTVRDAVKRARAEFDRRYCALQSGRQGRSHGRSAASSR